MNAKCSERLSMRTHLVLVRLCASYGICIICAKRALPGLMDAGPHRRMEGDVGDTMFRGLAVGKTWDAVGMSYIGAFLSALIVFLRTCCLS